MNDLKGSSQIGQRFQEIIADLMSYFGYLKGIGIEGFPFPEGRFKNTVSNSSPLPSKNITLDEIRKELGECRRCKLHRTRNTIVFGEGNKRAKLMIIGEGPGYEEDVQGKPFVGRAGQLLTKILQSIHLQREEVYITNIIKCRPPQNRNPEPDEIQSCHPFLQKQIHAIQPKVICALGTFAAQTLLKTNAKITALRGRFQEINGIKVIPTFHPAYLLRNPERKREVWEDMKQIFEWIQEDQKIDQPDGSDR